MTFDISNAIHIVSGPSAAGSLKQAYHFSSDQILVCYDPLACGPVPATTDLEQWKSTRDKYWSGIRVEYAYVLNAANDLYHNIELLTGNRPVVLWVATSLPEQLLAASVAYLYEELGLDSSKLSVVQVDLLRPKPKVVQWIRSMGELSPEKIRTELPPPRAWTEREWREYRMAWLTYTSDDPAALRDYLANPPEVDVLSKAMRRLVFRYPSEKTGLCSVDEEMLRQTKLKGSRAARIIGYTMGELMDTEEFIGDGVLFHRLTVMGSNALSSALVSIAGDPLKMRDCDVLITGFGERVLSGEVNNLTVNEANDWIGGVRLSGMWPLPFRRENDLIVPS